MSIINTRTRDVPINSYQINNYDISLQQHLNVHNPGVVYQMNPVKEDIQNAALFRYAIPPMEKAACLNTDMRPRDTRHDLLGVNDCERIKNNSVVNEDDDVNMRERLNTENTYFRNNQECNIDPFIPSWGKYSSSINIESDMKNIFRKTSCDGENIYVPSSNSVMYSKMAMKPDSTLISGHVAFKEQERMFGSVSRFFMEDTRQTRMGVNH